MNIMTVKTMTYPDQRPGTGGLRRTVTTFQQEHYLENFIQSVFDCVPALRGGKLVIGGDGRYWNRHAIQVALRMAAANGVACAVVGRAGFLSTPAASLMIRDRGAAGGFLFTASHNPAGPNGDFGIKFNIGTGGQASETLTGAIASRAASLGCFTIICGTPDLDLDRPGRVWLGGMEVEVCDPVMAYADRMETLFDFDLIRNRVESGLTFRFDAMHAVTGPYASEIFVDRLGMPEISLMRGIPMEDFGGLHADPNPHNAPGLIALASGQSPPDLIAASDGDGDRNMIIGPGMVVSPCDSLAVLAANATHIPGYRDGLAGVARSMPTSHAVDRVAARLGIDCHETPTGWRFFCNLLEAGRVTLCGEESFGTGSSHCREKDGLWAVLFWLNLMAVTGLGVSALLRAHWKDYGRTHFMRHDYTIEDSAVAVRIMDGLRETLATLPGRRFAGRAVTHADEFSYLDPVDGSQSDHQGLRIQMEGEARVVYRISGTDTSGATLRIYLEDHTADAAQFDEPASLALGALAEAARDLTRITPLTGATGPSLAV